MRYDAYKRDFGRGPADPDPEGGCIVMLCVLAFVAVCVSAKWIFGW